MTKGKFVGLKHINGEKDGRKFDFFTACIVSEMSERDVERGARGQDVHTPSVPERYLDVLCEKNIGKEVNVEFYYANRRENIAYCELAK